MSLQLGVVKFKGANRANEVLDGFIELHPSEGWPDQVGIITRNRLGLISVYRSFGYEWDEEDSGTAAGLGLGGMSGALVGALAGPAGAAAGAALGGSLGAVVGATDDDEDAPIYTVIRGKMEKNTSAILLLADEKIVDRMMKELGPEGVDKMRWTVSDQLYGNLEAAVRAVAREHAQPTPAP